MANSQRMVRKAVAPRESPLLHHASATTFAAVFLLMAMVVVLRATPVSAARSVVLPKGCDKEYIREMIISLCRPYNRRYRSLGSGKGEEKKEVLMSAEEQGRQDDGGATGWIASTATGTPLHQRPLHTFSEDLFMGEWLDDADPEEGSQRLIRAEKSLLKCCFKGCSWKDFVGVC